MYWLPYSSNTSHHPSQTPCLPWISYATQKLMLDSCKMPQKQSVAFFPSLKQNFMAYRSSKVSWRSDCIFEIHQLWQSGFSRVYSNCYCSCSFEPEIIKIGQSSHKMYSNNILNFQVFTTILNACTKKSGNLLNTTRFLVYTDRDLRKTTSGSFDFRYHWIPNTKLINISNKYLLLLFVKLGGIALTFISSDRLIHSWNGNH